MRRKFIFILLLFSLTLHVYPQLKLVSDGKIGIGVTNPQYPLHVEAIDVMFYYPDQSSLKLHLDDYEPIICSNDQISFRNATNTNYQDIVCLSCDEPSDSSAKSNVQIIKNGLDVIRQLRGVTFTWKNDSTGRRNPGLIAQEVESVIPEVVHANKNTGDKLLAYNKIIPYLIEAIKELDQKVKEQDQILEKLNNDASKKSKNVTSGESIQEINAILYQNTPNPFNNFTFIEYFINNDFNKASVNVYNLNGYQLLSYNTLTKGGGRIEISANQLKPGIYLYNLIIDGRVIDTKRMILTD